MGQPRKTSKNVNRFWTSGRIQGFCIAVLVFVFLHMISTFLADTENQSMLKRGDFASFYAAAMIVREGMASQIYDPLLLQSVENLYWPSLGGRYVLFPYAPFYALALSPLAWFPPLASKGIFTLLMILCLAGAVFLTRPQAPLLRQNFLALLTFLLAFFPLNFSISGGQNTALSLLLYAAMLSLFSKNDPKTDWAAGLCLGLWLFKPHFSLLFAAMFCAAGFYRPALSAAGVGIFYYAVSAWIAGFGWVFRWLEMLKQYESLELRFNFFNMISLTGFAACLARILPPGALIFRWLAYGGSFVLVAVFLRAAFRLRQRELAYRRYDLLKLMRAALPALLLASPHTVFYDGALCLAALAPYLKIERDRDILILIALTAAASAAVSFRSYLPLPPLFFGLAAVVFYLARKEKALLL